MNLTEILKNVPSGTKMYSPLFKEPITFVRVTNKCRFPIMCRTSASETIEFDSRGYFLVETASQNCMIFPTPEMTWDGYEYVPDGALIICKRDDKITQIACSKGGWTNDSSMPSYWWYDFEDGELCDETCCFWYDSVATLEELATIDELLAEKGYLFANKKLEKIKTFKKGDIIVDDIGIIALFDSVKEGSKPDVIVYQAIRRTNGNIIVKTDTGIGYTHRARRATREEEDLFFDSLTKAGYCWNGEEVVPVFKKGDIIMSEGGCIAIVDHIGEYGSFKDVVYYQCCLNYHGELTVKVDVGVGRMCNCKYAYTHDQERILKKLHEHAFVLDGDTVVKKKFNPKTLEGFQKVLVRSTPSAHWRCTFFSHMINGMAMCCSDNWPYCIPYKGNEHLRGTSNDCDAFYKWWENK